MSAFYLFLFFHGSYKDRSSNEEHVFLLSPVNILGRNLLANLLCKIKATVFCTLCGVPVALPREKAPDLVTMCLQKEKEYEREWQSPIALDKYPKLKQINSLLWALQNNDTGLIQDIEKFSIAIIVPQINFIGYNTATAQS